MDWSELDELLFADSWNEQLGLHRSNFAFRGRARADDDLSTSLVRLGGNPPAIERPLLRHFRKYAARDAVPEDSTWNWLALAQHHGPPTRLLDWTFSPYVALHFATARRTRPTRGLDDRLRPGARARAEEAARAARPRRRQRLHDGDGGRVRV